MGLGLLKGDTNGRDRTLLALLSRLRFTDEGDDMMAGGTFASCMCTCVRWTAKHARRREVPRCLRKTPTRGRHDQHDSICRGLRLQVSSTLHISDGAITLVLHSERCNADFGLCHVSQELKASDGGCMVEGTTGSFSYVDVLIELKYQVIHCVVIYVPDGSPFCPS